MKKTGYKKKIIRLCKDAGTYADYFDMSYDNLAYLLEILDKAKNQFKASGEKPVIAYTNTAGKTNLTENPALTSINKLSATILTYYEKLGLTPKGLKSLGVDLDKNEQGSLEGLLSNLGI